MTPIELKIASIIDERAFVDAAGVRNANDLARAIIAIIRPSRLATAKIIEPELWNPPLGAVDFISAETAKKAALDKASAIISIITGEKNGR